MVDRPGLLTPKQVARAIGVSEASVKRWCDRGLIETSRTDGGHRRLAIDSVCTFLEQTGHGVIRPDVLDLPSTTGHSDRIIRRGSEQFLASLVAGESAAAMQLVVDLREAGHSLSRIVDHVIVAAVCELGTGGSSTNDYSERQAVEICLGIIHVLRGELCELRRCAPVALTAALDGDPDMLTVSLAELILRECGWNAKSMGNLLPFATLKNAIRRHTPRLLFVNVGVVRDERRIVREFSLLHRVAARRETAVVAAGEKLADPKFRKHLAIDAWCPTFSELHREAKRRR